MSGYWVLVYRISRNNVMGLQLAVSWKAERDSIGRLCYERVSILYFTICIFESCVCVLCRARKATTVYVISIINSIAVSC